jgi:hypothetical protein
MAVGQAINNGNRNHSWLLVRQTTTETHSPPTAGGILIDHWARKIIHGCWSGDAPEAHKFRQRRTGPTTEKFNSPRFHKGQLKPNHRYF